MFSNTTNQVCTTVLYSTITLHNLFCYIVDIDITKMIYDITTHCMSTLICNYITGHAVNSTGLICIVTIWELGNNHAYTGRPLGWPDVG